MRMIRWMCDVKVHTAVVKAVTHCRWVHENITGYFAPLPVKSNKIEIKMLVHLSAS